MNFEVKKTTRSRVAAVMMGSASTAILGLFPAYAQNAGADDSLETVVVTGTLIKGIAPIGTNVVTFGAQDIKDTGALTPDSVLANIPQITNLFGNVAVASQISGRAQSFPPAIRNLDTSGHTTLVLINGVDVVGDGGLSNTTDASQLPGLVLDRVDVVLDGGSALYGAEAVAGVINFVTKKSFEGFEASTQYSTTENGYYKLDVGAIGGHAWSSGSAYGAVEWYDHSNQMVANVPVPRSNLIPLGGTLNSNVKTCPNPNVTVGSTNYALNSSAVANTPGALRSAVASSGPTSTTGSFNLCDPLLNSSFYPQEDQTSVWTQFNQEIMPGVNFSATANWAHNDVYGLNSAMPASNVIINKNNPYFQAIGTETQQTLSFDFSPLDGPNFAEITKTDQWAVTPQLDVALWGDWNLNILTTYQRAKNYRNAPQPDTVALNNAMVTSDPNFALDPYNLNLTPAAADHITDYRQVFASDQHLAAIKPTITGTLFELPAGPVKMAAGYQYEYTDYRGFDVTGPQGQNSGPAVFGGLYITSDAKRVTQSVFGELVVPLVSKEMGIPAIDSLNVDIQGRFDHYSDFGPTSNPKIGVTWNPIEDLTIRGSIGTSFAAPNLGDTSAAVDTRVSVATNSTIRVPLAISGESAAQDAIDANRPSISMPGGSPALQPQTANTHSYGFDYHPDFIPGLDVGLTAWHVSMFHIIAIVPYTNAALLYGVPAYAPYYIINPTLAQVTAFTTVNGQPVAQQGFAGYAQYYPANGSTNSTTPYLVRDLRRHNLGNQYNSGLDFHVAYGMDTDWGTVTGGLDGTNFTLYQTQPYAGAPRTDGLATNYSPYQFSANVGLRSGAFNSKVTLNYLAGYTVTGALPQTNVGAFVLTNLMLSYDLDGVRDFLSGSTFTLNINNLFDTQSPFINSGQGYPIAPTYESTLGRLFQISMTKKF